ncbi:MAG: OmpA family protein [Polyangiaceae bacterium]
MNPKYFPACFAFLATTGVVGAASAQTTPTGFAVNRFEPSERGSEWFALESLDFRGQARPAIGIVGDYQYRPLVVHNPDGAPGVPAGQPNDGSVRGSILRNVFTLNPGVSMVFFERLRLAASLPIVLFQDKGTGSTTVRAANGSNVTFAGPQDEQAIGDLRLGLDFRLFGDYDGPFRLAVGSQFWLPTGKQVNYTGDEEFRFSPRIMVAGDVSAFVYAARVSFNYRPERSYGSDAAPTFGSEIGFAASAGVKAGKRFVIGPEVWGSTAVIGDLRGKMATPVEGALGAHYTIPGDIRLGAGVGTGFNGGYGSPQVRALFNVEWMPSAEKKAPADSDGDGILDTEDACPTAFGVRSDDKTKNGCPADRDGDGVYDNVDACIDVPGEKTSDPKTNGCPPDRDGDGIYDSVDACIDVPGVKTEDPKTNGCPADRDGDGVYDKDDACPDVPGLKTSDPKTNGCPDPDRDKDGIPNGEDACPDEPGKANPDPKKNGCPVAQIKDDQIKLAPIKFKTGSAVIEKSKENDELLGALLETIKTNADRVKGLDIQGHTDNKGIPAANKKLSQDRANAVVKWLVDHGQPKAMFVAHGFGQEKPIDTNDTEAGRANNRRVEFHILKEAPAQKPAATKPVGTKPH